MRSNWEGMEVETGFTGDTSGSNDYWSRNQIRRCLRNDEEGFLMSMKELSLIFDFKAKIINFSAQSVGENLDD